MVPVPNPRVVYAKPIPQGAWPVVGEHLIYDNSRTIDPETVPLNGGFLTKVLYLSPEPYMRERMREEHIASYSSPMLAGAPVVGLCVMQIMRSEKPEFKPGDFVYGASHWELYTVQPYMEARRNWNPAEWPWWTANMDDFGGAQKIPDPKGAFPLSKYCSVAGSPGMTAYVSWKKYANAKKGETVFVSAGASAVGSLVIQLAKLYGMKVIASAGSDAKVEYMRSLGCDVPFNYKKNAYSEVLAEHGPLDVYYDNVGAEALAAAFDNMNLFGRVIICGQVAEYNVAPEDRFGIKNTDMIFKRNVTVSGFLAPYIAGEYMGKFLEDVPRMLVEGKLKSTERIYEGMEAAPQAFVDMLKGGWDTAEGKVVVSLVGI
ncbi:NAD(P)-binding protein [Schizophyllum commune H4-8]|nr:NAD(P)-binding protein [Schizophyllum commune H4-8]KAI5895550.1 NAD(P)-binding protein [Schizophyllum commune H4-8]